MDNDQWKVGVDIGGTFTDIVACHPDGSVRDAKTLTVPNNPLVGLQNALDAIGLQWSQVSHLMHGTTMVTNRLVEGRLPRVALLTTQGFEAVLEIGRASRQNLYRMDALPRPRPDVPQSLCFGVAERLDVKGNVLAELDEAEIDRVLSWLDEQKPDAIAISLLHSYVNPAHEKRLADAVRKSFSHVSASCEISPEAREFERTITTVLNAAVMPSASAYIDTLRAAVPASTNISLFHSGGGMAATDTMRSHPLALALSGPAAGASAAAAVCKALDIEYGLGFDMGGTTTDVCLIANGNAEISSARKLGGRPIRQPMVAVESVGAGGGSLVRIASGALTIGPESAGSDPGPVSYGRGGTEPTITDVNVLLGYIGADRPLGGEIRVDREKAAKAMEPMAAQLGETVQGFALGVLRVANSTMARALRKVTIEKGIDVRDTTLIAFGGAGPMHAVSLARDMGIERVLVPAFSSGFSAYGCVSSPYSVMRQKTVRLGSEQWSAERFAAERASLVEQAESALVEAGIAAQRIAYTETALIRYVGQSVGVQVPYTWPIEVGALGAAFRAIHQRNYGYQTDEPFLVESVRVEASAAIAGDTGAPLAVAATAASGGAVPAPVTVRQCIFDASGEQPTPCYARATLPVATAVAGPCLIEDAWSTVLIPPGSAVTADAFGHLHIEVNRD